MVYTHGNKWEYQGLMLEGLNISKAVVDGFKLVVLTYWSMLTYSFDGSTWENTNYFSTNGENQDVDMD